MTQRLQEPDSQCMDLAVSLLLHLYNGLIMVPTKGLS